MIYYHYRFLFESSFISQNRGRNLGRDRIFFRNPRLDTAEEIEDHPLGKLLQTYLEDAGPVE